MLVSRHVVGPSPSLSDVWSRRLLRQFAGSPCHTTLPRNASPRHLNPANAGRGVTSMKLNLRCRQCAKSTFDSAVGHSTTFALTFELFVDQV